VSDHVPVYIIFQWKLVRYDFWIHQKMRRPAGLRIYRLFENYIWVTRIFNPKGFWFFLLCYLM
jgi:hypothetical protein